MSKAGMERQRGHRPSRLSDAAPILDRIKGHEQVACLREGGVGWWIEPRKRLRIGNAPGRKLECQRGKVGLENFRRVMRLKRPRLLLGPQANTEPRPQPTRPPAPLIGRSQ